MNRKVALITGASSGIGEAIARQFAAQQCDLIITARREDRLKKLAQELELLHRVRVFTLSVDLQSKDAPREIFEFAKSRTHVDYLINNAGFGINKAFLGQPIERQLDMIDLNCKALVALSHYFGSEMIANRSGVILNVSSIASFVATPYFAVYGATKAFVTSFSQALNAELSPHNVFVAALCPGFTKTEFIGVAEYTGRAASASRMQTSDQVAAVAWSLCQNPRPIQISGFSNKVMIAMTRFVPRSTLTKISAALMLPK